MTTVNYKLYTLVFVQNGERILLGYKKRGFGVGKWNGFGGKVEEGETVRDGAVRELKEECGLAARDLQHLGLLKFHFEGKPFVLAVHVFKTAIYDGLLVESEEMRPAWFDIQKIPFDKMWLDDELWFPFMLQGKFFDGTFYFQGHSTILKYDLSETEQPPCIS